MTRALVIAVLALVRIVSSAALPADNDPALARLTEDRIVRFINTGMREEIGRAHV